MRCTPFLSVGWLIVAGVVAGVMPADATDVPIVGLKLIVVDKMVAAFQAKAVFVAKDPGVSKGTGTDPAQIEAMLHIAYDAVSGAFLMPQGADEPFLPFEVGSWLANSTSVGKYVNKDAPTGGSVKIGVIKPATLVKVVGKSLGDLPLDISSAPTGNVYVVDTITNGGETTRLCTQFSGCVHKLIAGDTGYKLICRGNSTGDAACTAATAPYPCGATTGGFCWFLGVPGADCDVMCAAAGRVYDAATETYAGSGGSDANCIDVLDALGQFGPPPFEPVGDCSDGFGCGARFRCAAPTTTSSASFGNIQRVCACM